MTELIPKPADKPTDKAPPKDAPVPHAAITDSADSKLHQREQMLLGLKTARLTKPNQQSFTIDRTSEGQGIVEDKRSNLANGGLKAHEPDGVASNAGTVSGNATNDLQSQTRPSGESLHISLNLFGKVIHHSSDNKLPITSPPSDSSVQKFAGDKLENSENRIAAVPSNNLSDAHSPADKQLEIAGAQILDSASAHFGREKIERLHISSGDVGSAVAASILGPDACQLLGPDATKQLGRRMIVFGVAPALGAFDHAHKEIQKNPFDVSIEAIRNISVGSLTSAIFEMVHPVVGAIALTGSTAALINDQMHSPENQQRNHSLQKIDEQINHASDKDLIALANHSKDLLSGDFYKGIFAVGTGLVGVPGGGAIKDELPKTLGALLDNDILKTNISHLSEEALKGLQSLLPGTEAVTAEGFRVRLEPGEQSGQENILFAIGKPTVMADLKRSDAVLSIIQKSDSRTALRDRVQDLSVATDEMTKLARMNFLNKSIEDAPEMQDALRMTSAIQKCMLALNERLERIRREVCDPTAQIEMQSIRVKLQSDRTASEIVKLADYDLKQKFLEHTIKEVLKSDFDWDGVSPGFLDSKFYQIRGDLVQRDISNQITNLVTSGRNDPAVEAIFEAPGLSAKTLDDFVGLGCPKDSPADHIGMDYLLVNKRNGQFYPIDMTASVTLPEGQIVSSFNSDGSMAFAGDKNVPSERMQFVIGARENAILTDREAYLEIAKTVVDMLSRSKGLSMFETPPPSSYAVSRSWMRKLIEMNVFRESLVKKRLTDWANHIPSSMAHVFNPRNR